MRSVQINLTGKKTDGKEVPVTFRAFNDQCQIIVEDRVIITVPVRYVFAICEAAVTEFPDANSELFNRTFKFSNN